MDGATLPCATWDLTASVRTGRHSRNVFATPQLRRWGLATCMCACPTWRVVAGVGSVVPPARLDRPHHRTLKGHIPARGAAGGGHCCWGIALAHAVRHLQMRHTQ